MGLAAQRAFVAQSARYAYGVVQQLVVGEEVRPNQRCWRWSLGDLNSLVAGQHVGAQQRHLEVDVDGRILFAR